MGIKLASPQDLVIGFTGDGGSMYTIQALHTATRYNINAKFIIMNNKKYKLLEDNILHYWQEENIEKHEYPDFFNITPDIDFVLLSKSLGINAIKINTL